MNPYRNRQLFLMVCFLAIISWENPAIAGLVKSGESRMQPPFYGSSDSIAYAVYDTANGTLNDPWGTGYPGGTGKPAMGSVFSDTSTNPFTAATLDTTASYLYLYEIANSTSHLGPVITEANIPISPFPGDVTSYGAFSTAVTPYEGLIFAAGDGLALDPSKIAYGHSGHVPRVTLTASTLTAKISVPNNDDSWSFIFGYTSNVAPSYAGTATTQLSDYTDENGIHHSAGDTGYVFGLATVPEPEILSLMLIGIFGIGCKKSKQ